MKAIFMTSLGGKLIEVSRRDIKPSPVYYCAVHEPVQAQVLYDAKIAQTITPKRERWVAQSMPITDAGFAVFLLEGIE